MNIIPVESKPVVNVGNDVNPPTLKVISKCARHTETGLKLLSTLQQTSDGYCKLSEDDMQGLFVIFASQANFLQSEYTSIVVNSTFNAETSRIFRSFENNNAAFSNNSLRNVRIAAELAALANRTNTTRTPFSSRGMALFNFQAKKSGRKIQNWGQLGSKF